MSDVQTFVAQCRRDRAAICPVKVLWREFNATLPAGRAGNWSRSNFLMELARAGFSIGEFANADCVIGLAPPAGGWQSKNGRLVFADVA